MSFATASYAGDAGFEEGRLTRLDQYGARWIEMEIAIFGQVSVFSVRRNRSKPEVKFTVVLYDRD